MSQSLIDSSDRDRFVSDLGSTFFVEAGAGAGKTSALVQRIVAFVKSGVSIDTIAAITFTDKAAGELKDRVRIGLQKAVRDDSEGIATREFCSQNIHLIDASAIETLHAFARRILGWYPLEAGLPPGFAMSDASGSDIAFTRWWNETLDAIVSEPEVGSSFAAALRLGFPLSCAFQIGKSLHENWDRIGKGPIVSCGDLQQAVAAVLDMAGHASSLLDQCTDPTDHLGAWLVDIAERYASAPAGKADSEEVAQWLSGIKKYPPGRKTSWPDVEETRARCAEIYEAVQQCQHAACYSLIVPFVNRVAEEVLAYADYRRRAGALEFHDLLVLARNLLRDNSAVRADLHERLKTLLIDEYQDTDPLQVEIVSLIAADPEQDLPGDWDQAEIPAGRLGFVGDPKQSIYRFRRADIGIYRKTGGSIGGNRLGFGSNFRSTAPLIDWVNAVFPKLIESAGNGCEYSAMTFARDVPPEHGSVKVIELCPENTNAPSLRVQEAAMVARAIRDAIDSPWEIFENCEFRPAKMSDIAILVPRRTILAEMEIALDDHRIPYRIESQSLLFKTREAAEALNLLKCVDDPDNEVALVGALQSSAFGFSDQELLDYRNHGGKWDYRKPAPQGSPRIIEALRTLRSYHEKRLDYSPAMLLQLLIRDCQVMEAALASSRPRDRWRRFKLICQQARQAGAGSGATLRQFIEWWRLSAAEDAKVSETIVSETDDDAVRIMTMHTAKGLEFPIVILSGLGIGSLTAKTRCFWSGSSEFLIHASKNSDFCTVGAAEHLDNEKLQDEAEQARLLYVGCTRAQDHLVVSACYKPKSKNAKPLLAQRLVKHLPEDFPRYEPPVTPLNLPEQPEECFIPDTSEGRDAWLARREQTLDRLSILTTRAATTIASEMGPKPDYTPARGNPLEDIDDSVPSRRGRAGTSIGRAVHAALQSVDLGRAGHDDIWPAAFAQASAEGLTDPQDVETVAQLVRRSLESPPVREAVASGRYWREVFVSTQVEGVLVEGFIDLMWETPDGNLRLLDYKTDRIKGLGDAEQRMQGYKYQAAVYALALEQTLGRLPSSVQFVFSSADPAIVITVDNIGEAIDAVRTHLPTCLPAGAV